MRLFECIITSHTNPNLSGVARFNHILAQRLGIRCMGLEYIQSVKKGPVLLSVKLRDVSVKELGILRRGVEHLRTNLIPFDLFFHSFSGLDIEYELVENCRTIYAGNTEITCMLEETGRKRPINAWCPALITAKETVHEATLNLFSFGMAHKLQINYYRMLKELLDRYRADYTIWVSTAFHEKANFGDFDSISHELTEIFGQRIQFLGFLSDSAVNYFLDRTQLFIAFFEKGIRTNNTSVFAAMNRGCAVLTNCDEHSPRWMKHRVNILDIHKLGPGDISASLLERIGRRARKDAGRFASWEGLVELFRKQTLKVSPHLYRKTLSRTANQPPSGS